MSAKKTKKVKSTKSGSATGGEKPSRKESGSSGVVAAGVVLVVFLLVVAALFSVFQTKLSLEVDGFTSQSKKTKTELREEIDLLKQELTEATSMEGSKISKRLARLELASEVNCSSYGDDYLTYLDTDMGWAFCYSSEWGEVEFAESSVRDQCKKGNRFWVRFSNQEAPLLNYVTNDFALTCDTDAPPFCWSCLGNVNSEDSNLIDNLGLDPNEVEVTNLEIGTGFVVIKVEQDLYDLTDDLYQTSAYYLPGLFQKGMYNLEIQTNGNEKEVERMINSIYVIQ